MPISIATKTRKLNIYNDSPTTVTTGTPVESDVPDKLFFPVIASAPIDPEPFEVLTCTTVTASATVTTSVADGFAQVQVGDAVSGTGIPAEATVTAKVSNSIITISDPATASGTVTLDFDPEAVTPTYYALELSHSPSANGEDLVISSVILHKYDGSLGGATATPSNSSQRISLTPAPGSPKGAMSIHVGNFLANLRVPPLP